MQDWTTVLGARPLTMKGRGTLAMFKLPSFVNSFKRSCVYPLDEHLLCRLHIRRVRTASA